MLLNVQTAWTVQQAGLSSSAMGPVWFSLAVSVYLRLFLLPGQTPRDGA